MNNPDQQIRLRTRKLGILMYDARLASRRSIEECATAMCVPPETYAAFEAGQKAPSLPELESFAYYLRIPLEHFWTKEALSEKDDGMSGENTMRLRAIRDRLIGALVRQKRMEANFSTHQLAEAVGVAEDDFKRFELGQLSIPLPVLELLAITLELPLENLFDHHGPIGSWRDQENSARDFSALPPHLKQFVSKPVNRPYIELAMRLSDLSVEKLRSVAEGLLEITY